MSNSNKNNKLSYKTSFGLALCRYNKNKNNCIEILSIKKRFTYHYSCFIHGYWNSHIRNESKINSYIKYLLNNMSFQEKLMILSMNFGNMWWYMWLKNPEKGINMFDTNFKDNSNIIQSVNDYKTFFQKKNKFEKKFMYDEGKYLHQMINNSKNCEEIWEIPKGSKNENEKDLDAAIREFTEETLFDNTYYNILYHVEPAISIYKDNKTIYKHIYFIAELNESGYNNKNIMFPKINFKSESQISEVADIKWLNISHIENINIPTKIKKNMIKLYKNVMNKFKKNKSFMTSYN